MLRCPLPRNVVAKFHILETESHAGRHTFAAKHLEVTARFTVGNLPELRGRLALPADRLVEGQRQLLRAWLSPAPPLF